jgi:bifunctional non-homologous end joining protein LigD
VRTATLHEPNIAMVGVGLEIEGVMAKRRDSIYQPGVRSDSWRKIKRPGWRDGRVWRTVTQG